MTQPPYPNRPPFFALRFNRLMLRSCLGARVGSDGCWLLAAIVSTEDAKRYTGPVTFYNGNLADQLGISVSAMQRARKKCVDAGWLHHIEGEKRKPAMYWVLIPSEEECKPDGPSDEAQVSSADSDPGRFPGQVDQENEPQSALLVSLTRKPTKKAGEIRPTFLPLPDPVPTPSSGVRTDEQPLKKHKQPRAETSDEAFARFWAAYPRKVSKQDAGKAFAKLDVTPELLGLILRAVESQSRSHDWTKEGGRFVPYPASWLNARRWEDEVSTAPSRRAYDATPDRNRPITAPPAWAAQPPT